MDIHTQWNLGIRAFEIVCNRPSFTNAGKPDIANELYACILGIDTVKDCLSDIELFSLKHDIKLITDNRYHDRFVIIDDDIYHFGGSLKDIGNKITTVIKTSFDKQTVLKLFIQKEKIS